MTRHTRLNNRHATFISSSEACKLLNVKPATLYTYVSRGLIYRLPTGSKRQSRYSLSDVLNVKSRADARAGHGPTAADALNWGQPVIETSISTVGEAGLGYRGHAVLELIRRNSRFESVAELLWTGQLPEEAPTWPTATVLPVGSESLPPTANPYIVTAALLPLLAAEDETRNVMTAENEYARARQIIRLVVAGIALPESPERAQEALEKPRIAAALATALGLPARKAAEHLDKVLVLCAEHELNASTFAARVAASTRADLYSCLSAALGAHSGPRQGLAVSRVLALLDEAKSGVDAARTLTARLERGESVFGFGQKLYPHGDPRAVPLMTAARRLRPACKDVKFLWDVVGTAKEARYYPPNLDMGIAMMTCALGIARKKAGALFMIGRLAGWVAHILEQRTQPELVRPRAMYVPLAR